MAIQPFVPGCVRGPRRLSSASELPCAHFVRSRAGAGRVSSAVAGSIQRAPVRKLPNGWSVAVLSLRFGTFPRHSAGSHLGRPAVAHTAGRTRPQALRRRRAGGPSASSSSPAASASSAAVHPLHTHPSSIATSAAMHSPQMYLPQSAPRAHSVAVLTWQFRWHWSQLARAGGRAPHLSYLVLHSSRGSRRLRAPARILALPAAPPLLRSATAIQYPSDPRATVSLTLNSWTVRRACSAPMGCASGPQHAGFPHRVALPVMSVHVHPPHTTALACAPASPSSGGIMITARSARAARAIILRAVARGSPVVMAASTRRPAHAIGPPPGRRLSPKGPRSSAGHTVAYYYIPS